MAFVYTAVLVFGLDSGISAANFSRGMQALQPNLPLLGFVALLAAAACILRELFKNGKGRRRRRACCSACYCFLCSLISPGVGELSAEALPALTLQSENLLEGASVTFESLKNGEKADACRAFVGRGRLLDARRIRHAILPEGA